MNEGWMQVLAIILGNIAIILACRFLFPGERHRKEK